jgi:protein-L-isoaspartate(D-aspartate) O-methyltransferase
MGDPNGTALRRELIEELRGLGVLTDPRVADAFLVIARERFVPEVVERDGLRAVYANNAIVIQWGAHGLPTSSSSQPSIMAAMLEGLDPQPGQRVLEVGAGSGYNAALLAALVGPTGGVVSVEIDPEIAARARAALEAAGSPAQVVVGDGRGGWPQGAPYDRIIVTAGSAGVPRAWFDQLAAGGRLVLPLQVSSAAQAMQVVCLLDKDQAGFAPAGAIRGGFMPLRPAPDAASPLPPSVGASEQLEGTGPGRLLGQLSGVGLVTMSELARRRLLALTLGRARAQRLGRLPRYPLELFVALAARDDRLITHFGAGAASLGIVDRRGHGVALLGGGHQTVTRILAYGAPRPEAELISLVEAWRALGRPAEDRLGIGVRYGDRVGGRHWRTARRGDATLTLDWVPTPPRRPRRPHVAVTVNQHGGGPRDQPGPRRTRPGRP